MPIRKVISSPCNIYTSFFLEVVNSSRLNIIWLNLHVWPTKSLYIERCTISLVTVVLVLFLQDYLQM
jgi:hypothetical protein